MGTKIDIGSLLGTMIDAFPQKLGPKMTQQKTEILNVTWQALPPGTPEVVIMYSKIFLYIHEDFVRKILICYESKIRNENRV
jgi:hypothetical protein